MATINIDKNTHTHNLCVFFFSSCEFSFSCNICEYSFAFILSLRKSSNFSSALFIVVVVAVALFSSLPTHPWKCSLHTISSMPPLDKKKKRVNNTNWRRNIEWRVTIVCTQQQGIHTCVWQFFWCEWARELQFFANNTKIACHGPMSVWVPPRASERVRVNAFNHINKKRIHMWNVASPSLHPS